MPCLSLKCFDSNCSLVLLCKFQFSDRAPNLASEAQIELGHFITQSQIIVIFVSKGYLKVMQLFCNF